ncbi:MAG: hypothetical protein MJZ74_00410 [Muribaculaceae bacterium]|nr:hypothetical protein [Muribaculaceae bacterium]
MKKSIIILACLCSAAIAYAQSVTAVDALQVSGTKSGQAVDESLLFDTDTVMVTFDASGSPMLDARTFAIQDTDTLRINPAQGFKVQGILDAQSGNYYSTFYTSMGAMRMGNEGAKAYAAVVDKIDADATGYLKLTEVAGANSGLIHRGEPVILVAGDSEVILLPSANSDPATADNQLLGVDGDLDNVPTGVYTLAAGSGGVAFYPGGDIANNSAYIMGDASATMFRLTDDTPTGVKEILIEGREIHAIYNAAGQQVNKLQPGVNIILFKDGTSAKVMK